MKESRKDMEFVREILGVWTKDNEYEELLSLWTEYRTRTNHLPKEYFREAAKIHLEIFGDIPHDEKYHRAKMESLRKIQIKREKT